MSHKRRKIVRMSYWTALSYLRRELGPVVVLDDEGMRLKC
jgi:hypothetical protein